MHQMKNKNIEHSLNIQGAVLIEWYFDLQLPMQ